MPEMLGTDFIDAAHSILPDLPSIIITGDPTPIPLKYRNYPIIEKGQINFINQLLEQVLVVLSGDVPEKLHNRKKSKTISGTGLLNRRKYNKKQSDTYKLQI
jgi:NifB/MoaA-like Fe-S oxidoreductase